jgi:hypothetical protein
LGSPNLDASDKDDEDGDADADASGNDAGVDGDQFRTALAVSAVPSTPSAPCGQKRKTIADFIAKVSARERDNRIKIARINATAKTERATQ